MRNENDKTMKYRHLLSILTVAAALVSSLAAGAQQPLQRDSVKVYFRQGKTEFDSFYEGNARRFMEFSNRVRALQRDTLAKVERVIVLANASPEGSAEANERIAYKRAQNIAEYLTLTLRFDPNAFEVHYNSLDWKLFEQLVRDDPYVPMRRELLPLIEDRDLTRIKVVRFQRAWDYMLENLFPEMRSTVVVFEYSVDEPLPPIETVPAPPVVQEQERTEPDTGWKYVAPLPDDEEDGFDLDLSEALPWSCYIKTSLLPWPLLDANLGFEFEMGRHLSFSIPVIYGALDWFDTLAKFRVAGTQPELRLWFRDDFSGPFLAAHGTLAWFNVALPSEEFRFQDRDGRHPAYGAGMNLGWKFRLDRGRADRWGLELSAGGGWLHLDYDTFYNVENGRYSHSEVRDYFGLDHASIAITYRFGR